MKNTIRTLEHFALSLMLSLVLACSVVGSAFGEPATESNAQIPPASPEAPANDLNGDPQDPENEEGPAPLANSSLPLSYDSRDHGFITSVKFQNPWGTCWAFATIAALEASALRQGLTTDPALDLSELHLAWFTYRPQQSGSQAGEGILLDDHVDIPLEAASTLDAIATLSAGQGPVAESRVPYRNHSNSILSYAIDVNGSIFDIEEYLPNDGIVSSEEDWWVSEDTRFESALSLRSAKILAPPTQGNESYDREAEAAIKQEVLDNGAVVVTYYADQSYPGDNPNADYFNYTNWAQYADIAEAPNHSTLIVGWDDGYPKENFQAESNQLPPGDGAWIVKNSWGALINDVPHRNEWGLLNTEELNTGYFHLSYYDKTISDLTSFVAAPAYNDEILYQYDYLGFSSILTSFHWTYEAKDYEHAAKSANVFTAKADQLLTAVSLAAPEPNTSATIEVYTLPDNTATLDQGNLVHTQHYETDRAGFYRIELDTPIELRKGDRFAVAQTIMVDDLYHLVLEAAADGGDPGSGPVGDQLSISDIETRVTLPDTTMSCVINEGESFVIDPEAGTGKWEDLATKQIYPEDALQGNAMIKAYATKADLGPLPAVDPLPTEVPSDKPQATVPSRTADSTTAPLGLGLTGALLGSLLLIASQKTRQARTETSLTAHTPH